MKITKYTSSIEGDTIEDINSQIEELRKGLGASDFYITNEQYEYGDGYYPCIAYKVDETEDEKKVREEREQISRLRIEQQRRYTYEQLKKEFEGK